MAAKNDYITIAPVTPKGKWTICMRRVGTKDRFAPVAEARTQTAADGIVEALNLMQGDLKKLEVPAQRVLEEVRTSLANERKVVDALRGDIRTLNNKVRSLEGEVSTNKRLYEQKSSEALRLCAEINDLKAHLIAQTTPKELTKV